MEKEESYKPFDKLFESRQDFGNNLVKIIETIKPQDFSDLANSELENDTRVISIDANWGYGKTTFITSLKEELEHKDFTVFTFNAWTSDYERNPLSVFIQELVPQFMKACNLDTEQTKKYYGKINSFIARSNEVLKLVTNVLPIIPEIDLIGIGTSVKKSEETIKENDSSIMKYVYDESEISLAIKNFKKSLNELPINPDKKVIILIDEIDRCRPTFAVELLEIIKHFFDTGKFLFVLSVCMKQLKESVKQIYGSNFEGDGYFRRFIDYEFTLPLPKFFDTKDFLTNNFSSLNATSKLFFRNNWRLISYFQSCYLNQDISLRTCEKINRYMDVTLRLFSTTYYYSDSSKNYLAFAIFCKFLAPNLFYDYFINNELPSKIVETEKEAILKSFRFSRFNDDGLHEYLYKDNLEITVLDFLKVLSNYDKRSINTPNTGKKELLVMEIKKNNHLYSNGGLEIKREINSGVILEIKPIQEYFNKKQLDSILLFG